MTLLVPEAKFSIGKSSTTAPAAAESLSQVDMSLDDMIKNRRKTQSTTTAAAAGRRAGRARKPNVADKAIGRQRATREAAVNARRGITTTNKPSPMEIERQVYRQSRMSTDKKKKTTGGPRNRKDAAAQIMARKQEKTTNAKKQQQQQQQHQKTAGPQVYVSGARRPPSKQAVTAAVDAMQKKGFQVPHGMQMVISFAPAPTTTTTAADTKKKATTTNNNQINKGGNQYQKGKEGGGRKK